jgi:hypothetical protein
MQAERRRYEKAGYRHHVDSGCRALVPGSVKSDEAFGCAGRNGENSRDRGRPLASSHRQGVSVMKLDRQKKIKKREQRAKRQQTKLKEDFTRIFKAMNVDLDFKRLSNAAEYMLLGARFPQPVVIVEVDNEPPERVADIRRAVEDTLETTTFESPGGDEISARDFFRYCVALRDMIMFMLQKKWGGNFTPQFQDAKRKFEDFCARVADKELHRLLSEIDTALCAFSRIESAIFWYTPEFKRNGIGKGQFTVTVHKKKAEMLRLKSDRGTRPAYRLGGSLGLHGQHWSCLPRRLMGVDSDGYFPVYIQDHAILRLHERLPLPGWEGEIHDCIWLSFIDPKMTVGPTGDKLIEYRFCDFKLGYFPIELIDDKILIKTFLFLTMTGTPEAKLLYRNCGLMRRDIEELSFDSIDTFLNTDVTEDPELRALLNRCGCGHLLEMIRPEDRTELVRGRASQIRHYLGMKTI